MKNFIIFFLRVIVISITGIPLFFIGLPLLWILGVKKLRIRHSDAMDILAGREYQELPVLKFEHKPFNPEKDIGINSKEYNEIINDLIFGNEEDNIKE